MTTQLHAKNAGKKLLLSGLVSAVAALPVSFSAPAPAEALQVQVTPSTPRLGDTLSVFITIDNPSSDNTPKVTVGKETYPTFAIGPNQYRAFIPTTPLERPGSRQIQVTANDGQTENVAVQVSTRRFPVQRINLPPVKPESRQQKWNCGGYGNSGQW